MTDLLEVAVEPDRHVRQLGTTDSLTTAPHRDAVRRLEHLDELLIGPLHGPEVATRACSMCVARRWQAVRPQILRDALETGSRTMAAHGVGLVNPFVETTATAVETVAAEQVSHSVSRYSQVFFVDRESLHVGRHAVLADPECQQCGHLDDDAEGVPRLESVTKKSPWDFRGRSIFDYDLDGDPLVGPVCGALGPRSVSDLTSTTTSATIGCLTTRSGNYLREIFWGGHEDSFGVSNRVGLLEGLERVAAMRPHGRRTVARAAYDRLDVPAVDPRDCGLYDAAFHEAFPWVDPFDPGKEINWVWGYSLRDRRPVLVPEVLAYYHIPGQQHRFVQESSSGCATGGSITEAAFFGLLELVERDAFVIGWYAGRPLPEIDVASIRSRESRATIARLEMAGYRARFFDARVTFDVPTIIAVAERREPGLGALCFGAGASFDPEAALASALCEIATDAPNSRLRTANHQERLEAMVDDLDRVLSLHDHPLLYGLPQMRRHAGFLLDTEEPAQSMAERFECKRPVPRPADDLRGDLDLLVDAVATAGFDTVIVDQTMRSQQECGVHTVSVVSPGLVPVDFGWARQRARHMPRTRSARHEAGLDASPLTANQLTRAPHPLP